MTVAGMDLADHMCHAKCSMGCTGPNCYCDGYEAGATPKKVFCLPPSLCRKAPAGPLQPKKSMRDIGRDQGALRSKPGYGQSLRFRAFHELGCWTTTNAEIESHFG